MVRYNFEANQEWQSQLPKGVLFSSAFAILPARSRSFSNEEPNSVVEARAAKGLDLMM